MFKLELKFQNITLREYTLKDGTNLSIGRDLKNDIVLNEPDVSRAHLYADKTGDELRPHFVHQKGAQTAEASRS
jgi:pSer/pThr/pTyr-binding forkhead associated (FHA) protein